MSQSMQLKARIKNLAVKHHIPAQAVLQNYLMECVLERISVSKYKDKFVIKGGLLIGSLVGITSRTTMDMDATLRGYPLSEDALRSAWMEICAIPLDDQVSLSFEHILPIREADEYGGFRVALLARYESIKTPLKIDVTTGDVITPAAVRYEYQSNFGDKEIEIWAYNIETILAEKVETILRRSVLNTRPRDYYDVYILTKNCEDAFDRDMFRSALKATAESRNSLEALAEKDQILQAIQSDAAIRPRWDRYRNDNYYAREIEFEAVMNAIVHILRS